MVEKATFITCNTDAGFSYRNKIGTYAYWIKGSGKHLHGSGVFKERCSNPWECEMKAMINALHVLKKEGHPPIIGFIFNRDAENAKTSKKAKHPLQRKLWSDINYFKRDAQRRLGRPKFDSITKNSKSYAIFRYVKAHSNGADKRSWVNNWLDNQCKLRFKEWLDNHLKQNI